MFIVSQCVLAVNRAKLGKRLCTSHKLWYNRYMQAIEVRHVSYQYPSTDGQQPALADVSLCVNEGEFVVLLGSNGSGKSTLAKLLNGLLQPTGGQVTVYGEATDSNDDEVIYRIRSTVGMVFQNPDNQMVASIIEDDVAFGPENLGVPRDEMCKRVQWALQSVGMWEYRRHTPNKLSGGQKQRVAIAGVLAMKPKVLVLDESTAMLDPVGRREVLQVLHHLNREEHITVIHITHHMAECIDADRAVVLHAGRVMYDGVPSALFADSELVAKTGLELPPVAYVADGLRRSGWDIPVDTLSADTLCDAIAAHLPRCVLPDTDVDTIPCANADTVIDMQEVGYTYMKKSPYEQRALDKVSLEVREGQLVAIVGQTGSGKSTLVQHLNGLIKREEGRMTVCGIDLTVRKPDWKKLRFSVGMVFQYPEYQLFDDTVNKDVGFGCRNAKIDKDETAARVRSALIDVGLDPDQIGERSPFDLSGGQKRRVAIAGVVALRPRVLVLDEPTAGLDPKGKRDILSLVDRLHSTVCPTVLMVSHDMEAVAQYADRVVLLQQGKVVLDGTPKQLFRMGAQLNEVGLTLPFAADMCNRLERRGIVLPMCLTPQKLLSVLLDAARRAGL